MSDKKIEIKDNVRNLADNIKIEISENGTAVINEEQYAETLDSIKMSLDDVKKIQKHNATVIAAATLALGEAAVPFMKKNTDISQVSLEMKMGRDNATIHFDRSVEKPNGKDETKTVYGVSDIFYRSQAGANLTDLKRVQEHLSKLAQEELS